MWQSKPLLLVVLLLCLSGSLSVRAAEPTPDSYPRVQSRAGWEASAAAQGLPPLTPRKIWWTLGWNAKTTTSHCIGDPRSPLCAAETMMACEAQGDRPVLHSHQRSELCGKQFILSRTVAESSIGFDALRL